MSKERNIFDREQRLSRLMCSAQQGDRHAYEALLTEVATMLRVFVRKRVKRREWIEDLVQEILLSIHRAS